MHDTTKAQPQPALSKATPAQLVRTLSHPNGWWRDTAQQLLVAARRQVGGAAADAAGGAGARLADEAARAVDARRPRRDRREVVQKALADTSPTCAPRRSGCPSAGCADASSPIAAAVLKLAERSELDRPAAAGGVDRRDAGGGAARAGGRDADEVRRRSDSRRRDDQRPEGAGGRSARTACCSRTSQPARPTRSAMLAAAVAKSGDVTPCRRSWRARPTPAMPAWQRTALSAGARHRAAHAGRRRRGGRGGGRRRPRRGAPARPVSLPAEPTALVALARRPTTTGRVAKRVVAKLDWPGKPAPVVEAAPLTPPSSRSDTMPAPSSTRASASAATSRTARARKSSPPSLVDSRLRERAGSRRRRSGSCWAARKGRSG